MHVLIATPTAGHVVTTAYVHSLIAATQAFTAAGWQYQHQIFNGADVELARNYLVSELLRDEYLTHILFLDSDMLIDRPVFERLIQADQAIAGAIYTNRQMDWANYSKMIRGGATEGAARATSMRFNVRMLGETIDIRNGWCEVQALGTGCLMIKREVFNTLIRTNGVRQIRNALLESTVGNVTLYDFFTCIMQNDGDKLGEDFSFCKRARNSGFQIWGMADVAIGHVGRHDFAARYIDFLNHTAKAEDLPPSNG